MLFSDYVRTDLSYMQPTEADFAFLDRSARPEAERVRQLVGRCIANYAPDHVEELVLRLKSGDRRHFRSASFELLLHEYLRQLGFELTPHPVLPNGSAKHPDFLVKCPGGGQLYLEAASATEDGGTDESASARIAVALQVLDSKANPDFMVGIRWKGSPTTQPSGNKLSAAVVEWLTTLDADSLVGVDSDDLPEIEWTHEQWTVCITAIPVRKEARGRARRLIGTRSGDVTWIDTWSPIRDTVISKSKRYGVLDLPLVVAVNVSAFALDEIDEVQALFGQEQVVFDGTDPSVPPREERAANGAWRGPSGPRARRSSGAWLFPDLTPYSVAGRKNTLYLNPWAQYQVPEGFLVMPHMKPINGDLIPHPGRSFVEVFELPPQWPEG